jgi:hypothetical protein
MPEQRNEPRRTRTSAPVDADEFTLADAKAFIDVVPWTPAKWAAGTDARHEYVMVMWAEVDGDQFHAFYRLIREQGYKAKWTNPETGKTYYNRYLELGEWTYWWVPRTMNREHRSTPTLRTPASAAETEAQLSLDGKGGTHGNRD